jgi:hypothetical protein
MDTHGNTQHLVPGVAEWVEISTMAPTQCYKDKEKLNLGFNFIHPVHT